MNINSKVTNIITNELDEKTLCAYKNLSSNWQIIKITNFIWQNAYQISRPNSAMCRQTSSIYPSRI